MKTLDRYIGRAVAGAILTVTVVLVAVFSFFKFIDELDAVGRGSYGVLQVAEYVLLSMPHLAYELFPMAALLGSLIALGNLVATSEITVIRAAGVSLGRIVLSVLKAGVVIMVIAVIVGEFIAPPSEQVGRHRRSIAQSDQIALKTKHGFWARDGASYINIRRVLPGNRVEDIYIYEFDEDHRLRVSTHARSAEYRDGRWLLNGIKQTDIGDERITGRQVDQAVWDSLLRPALINVVMIDPASLSMRELSGHISYQRANAQDSQRYEQALWTKVVYPLATGVMVFLAVPLVFGASRSVGVGQRIMLGAVIGLVFHIVNQAAGHLGVVYHLSPALSVAAPTLVVLGVGIVLLRRIP